MAEGLNLAAGAKVAVAKYYQNQGAFPADNATAGLEAPTNITGSYVTRVDVTDGGAIQITFGNRSHLKIIDAVLSMTPTDVNGSVRWTCSGDARLGDKCLPPACR